MTVSTTTTKNSASGNGSTTSFTYSFVITAASELKVFIRTNATGVETLKTDGTHYNVAGVGSASGGTVTFTSGNIPASGETVVLCATRHSRKEPTMSKTIPSHPLRMRPRSISLPTKFKNCRRRWTDRSRHQRR